MSKTQELKVARTYYCYNKSDKKPANHKFMNPNRKLVRNAFGTPDVDDTNDNMRSEFAFVNGVLHTETAEENELLDCYVSGKPYKMQNGRMFEPWLATCIFKSEELTNDSKPRTIIETREKIMVAQESLELMSVDKIRSLITEKIGIEVPKDIITKDELMKILSENGHII